MSPELETLDQLLGGDIPLSVVRCIFDDEARFARGVYAMLEAGEVRLLNDDGAEILLWRWKEELTASIDTEENCVFLSITEAGAKRIA